MSAEEESWRTAVADYLAGSYKFALVVSFGVGLAVAMGVVAFKPDLLKEEDPGIVILAVLVLPMVVTAIALMIWARAWRKRRAG